MAGPNRSWAWDQFELDINQGELDILNDSELDDAGLDRTTQVNYETRFIDDLYGTDDAQWTGEGLPSDYGSPSGAEGALRTAERHRSSYLGVDTTVWGLDLRRVDNEALEIGSNEHYQHLTRGEVDWAHYETDPAYIKAFERANIDYDVDATAQDKVDWIREANETIGQGDDDKDNREPPTGEYDADKIRTETDTEGNTQLFINGERQPTLSERYNTIDPETGERSGRLEIGFTATRKDEDGNDVEYTVGPKGKLSESAFDPVAGPPTPVVKPQINIPNVKVKVPASLSQWKTHAKQTLKVGGKK